MLACRSFLIYIACFYIFRLINVKLRELQGKDADDVIVPEDDVIADKEAVMVEEVQSDTHIAQPDAVSLKEEEIENKDDVPPPPTTDDQETLATDTHPPETIETCPPDTTEAQRDTTDSTPADSSETNALDGTEVQPDATETKPAETTETTDEAKEKGWCWFEMIISATIAVDNLQSADAIGVFAVHSLNLSQ